MIQKVKPCFVDRFINWSLTLAPMGNHDLYKCHQSDIRQSIRVYISQWEMLHCIPLGWVFWGKKLHIIIARFEYVYSGAIISQYGILLLIDQTTYCTLNALVHRHLLTQINLSDRYAYRQKLYSATLQAIGTRINRHYDSVSHRYTYIQTL